MRVSLYESSFVVCNAYWLNFSFLLLQKKPFYTNTSAGKHLKSPTFLLSEKNYEKYKLVACIISPFNYFIYYFLTLHQQQKLNGEKMNDYIFILMQCITYLGIKTAQSSKMFNSQKSFTRKTWWWFFIFHEICKSWMIYLHPVKTTWPYLNLKSYLKTH